MEEKERRLDKPIIIRIQEESRTDRHIPVCLDLYATETPDASTNAPTPQAGHLAWGAKWCSEGEDGTAPLS